MRMAGIENGNLERLNYCIREVDRMRPRMHKHDSELTTHGLEIDVLKGKTDELDLELKALKGALATSSSTTTSLLNRWREGAIILLGSALLYYLLRFGIPTIGG
jgi:hypothetical protein